MLLIIVISKEIDTRENAERLSGIVEEKIASLEFDEFDAKTTDPITEPE